MRQALITALEKQFEAEISAADASIKLLLENSVAVSEHLNHQKELDCLLHKIASAEEKLSVLKDYNIPKEEM
jgi:DNA-binding transcriptional regulator LsrR (DeoR family)|tara:strand:- start:256 stop:471 length:216 start_codon:yes stop_codon:yes gene_type:complete